MNKGACYALWASRCDLRDPRWGNPGFPAMLVLFVFLHLLRDLAVMFRNRLFFARSIHRHTSCCNLIELICPYDGVSLLAFVLFCGAVCFLVLFCWFLFSGDRTALGLWTAYRSMLSFDSQ